MDTRGGVFLKQRGEEVAFDPGEEAHEQRFVPWKPNCAGRCLFDTRAAPDEKGQEHF